MATIGSKNDIGGLNDEKAAMKNRNMAISWEKETTNLIVDVLEDRAKKMIKASSKAAEERLHKEIEDIKKEQDSIAKQLEESAKKQEVIKEKIRQATTDAERKAQEDQLKIAEKSYKKLIDQKNKYAEQISYLDTQIIEEQEKADDRMLKAKQAAQKNMYLKLSATEKLQFQKQKEEKLKSAKEDLQAETEISKERLKLIEEENRQLEEEKKNAATKEQKEAIELKQKALEDEKKNVSEEIALGEKRLDVLKNEESQSKAIIKSMEEAGMSRQEKLKKRNEELKKETSEARQNLVADEARKRELEEKQENGELSEEENKELEQLNKNIEENSKKINDNNKELAKNSLALKATQIWNDSLKQIDSKIAALYENSAKYNARLYGADIGSRNAGSIFGGTGSVLGLQYNKLLNTVSQQVGLNPLVSQVAVIKNIQQLIDMGVAQNVELRAYLATITDQIASTFNVLDQTLLRLSRMQQADTTAYRLGMEAALTEFFNKNFSDSTFMNDMHDTVFGAIYDANSLMTAEESAEFEYIVQKWLGSLYSVGMSDAGIQKIAQGINYLSTGNYSGMASDESLQNVFAMSASRAGLNYAELLQKGLDKSSVNKLLESMVGYLRDISQNTIDNKVVANAFSSVFGMSVSDMSSILNLSDQDIHNILSSTLSYDDMGKNLVAATGRIIKNTHISQLTNNLFDNLVTTMATGIGDSVVNYVLWKTANTLMDMGIDIDLPFVNVWGFGIDLHTTLLSLVKTGVAGISLLGQLISGVLGGSLNNLAMFMGLGSTEKLYNSWGATQVTDRGQTREDILKGRQKYSSYSAAIEAPFASSLFSGDLGEEQQTQETGGGNTQDIQNQSLTQASDNAKDMNETVGGQEGAPEKTVEDIYDALFTYKFPVYTIDMLALGAAVGKSGSTASRLSYLSYLNQITNADISELKEGSDSYDEATYKSVTSVVQALSSQVPGLLASSLSDPNADPILVNINDFGELSRTTLKNAILEVLLNNRQTIAQEEQQKLQEQSQAETEEQTVNDLLQSIIDTISSTVNVKISEIDPMVSTRFSV